MRSGRSNYKRWLAFLLLSGALNLVVFAELVDIVKPSFDQSEPTEIAFLGESDLSQVLPALDSPPENNETTPEHSKPKPSKKPDDPEEVKPPPAPPEVAKVEPPKPKPVPEPQPVPVTPPPVLELPKERLKMVDQDLAEEEPDNPEARFLAQKNHRVKEDTRSENTNLIAALRSKAPAPSSPSDNQLPNPGDRDQKIAELEDHKSPSKDLPRGRPITGQGGPAPRSPQAPPVRGKLAMRDLTPQSVEQKGPKKAREGVELAENGQGPLPLARQGEGQERAQAAAKGKPQRYNLLGLKPLDYDRIVGFDTAEKERRQAARGERSHTPGHWERVQQKLALMRSSLENFTPEVRPGNQAELGTRAHPFAAYIAEMHRQIHKLWAFGFLADLDARTSRSAYNDPNLWTQLELVLHPDGSLAKATIVRSSGQSGFDTAALDVVASAAPFPIPPQAIRSANGKVYLDWRFHRDERQCGTFGVDPHILTTVGDNQDHDTSEVKRGEPAATPRTLHRGTGGAAAIAVPGDRATPPAAPPSQTAVEPAQVPDAARDAAQGWFDAYTRGDVGWLAGWSAVPFVAGGQISARDGAAIKHMYAQLLQEAGSSRRLERFDVYTPAGIRQERGALPPGGELEGMYFAVGQVGSDEIILLLKKSDQGWRVAGLAR